MIALLLAVLAWRFLRRLALMAIVAALVIFVLDGLSNAPPQPHHHQSPRVASMLGSVEHDLQQAVVSR